jgi:hypothetical protein
MKTRLKVESKGEAELTSRFVALVSQDVIDEIQGQIRLVEPSLVISQRNQDFVVLSE